MNRQDEQIRRACAELAQEETERLEGSLTFSEIRQAEALYQRHREKALKLIRGGSQRFPWRKTLAWTAAAAALVGAVYLALNRAPQDRVPAQQPPAASVVPYYSPVPTFSPVPSAAPTIKPTATPKSTDIPTQTPTSSPTFTPEPTTTPTPAPTETPTAAPTEAPAETPTPTPTSTATPTAEPTPEPTAQPEEILTETEAPVTAPEGWTGLFFPQALPEGSTLAYISQENGRHTAAYTVGGREIQITEYDTAQALALDRGAAARYVQLGDLIALRSETDVGVTFIWNQDGRTLSVACEDADAEDIARSVRRVR